MPVCPKMSDEDAIVQNEANGTIWHIGWEAVSENVRSTFALFGVAGRGELLAY
jgi:hypothetical protein